MATRRNDISIIKKYANRRLYHTAISQYITLEDVAEMVRKGEELKVVDARTGADLTRAILTQIIVEEEAKGENMLPIKFLREVIRMYNNNLRPMVPQYLDHMMDTLMSNQENLSKYWSDHLDNTQKTLEKSIGILPTQAVQKFNSGVEEVTRQNMAIIESAMKMFTPFSNTTPEAADKKQKLNSLKQQLKTLQNKINELEQMTD